MKPPLLAGQIDMPERFFLALSAVLCTGLGSGDLSVAAGRVRLTDTGYEHWLGGITAANTTAVLDVTGLAIPRRAVACCEATLMCRIQTGQANRSIL